MPYILGTSSPADCVTIDPSKSLALYLVARPPSSEGAAQVKASEGVVRIPLNSPGFAIHSVCAFESGPGELTLLTTAWKTETVGSGQVMGGLLGAWEGQAPRFDSIPTTLLYETIVDAGKGTLIRHAPVKGMEEQVVEHPHINPNMEGLPVRYIWMSIGSSSGLSSPPIGYTRLDRHTGDRQIWMAPIHTYCEEVVVVPKSNTEAEDECWIVASLFDSVKVLSSVAIFDGKDMAKGPVARIWLKHALPHSLHGCFVRE